MECASRAKKHLKRQVITIDDDDDEKPAVKKEAMEADSARIVKELQEKLAKAEKRTERVIQIAGGYLARAELLEGLLDQKNNIVSNEKAEMEKRIEELTRELAQCRRELQLQQQQKTQLELQQQPHQMQVQQEQSQLELRDQRPATNGDSDETSESHSGTARQRPNTIADYIRNLNGLARKIMEENASHSDVARFDKCVIDLTANNCARLNKLISHLRAYSESDGCKYLTECAALFLGGLDVSTVEEKEEARRFYISSLLDHFYASRSHDNVFVEISNLLIEQSAKLSKVRLVSIIYSVSSKLEAINLNDNINAQWYECISIIINRLSEETDRDGQSSSPLVPSLLSRWLREASNITALASAVEIAHQCGASSILRSCVHSELQGKLDSFKNINTEKPTNNTGYRWNKSRCSIESITQFVEDWVDQYLSSTSEEIESRASVLRMEQILGIYAEEENEDEDQNQDFDEEEKDEEIEDEEEERQEEQEEEDEREEEEEEEDEREEEEEEEDEREEEEDEEDVELTEEGEDGDWDEAEDVDEEEEEESTCSSVDVNVLQIECPNWNEPSGHSNEREEESSQWTWKAIVTGAAQGMRGLFGKFVPSSSILPASRWSSPN